VARATDLTDELRVAWLLGDRGFQTLAKSGIGVPEGAGRAAEVGADGDTALVGAGAGGGASGALVGPVPAVEPLAAPDRGGRGRRERDRQAA
jgi:hypothetical protein